MAENTVNEQDLLNSICRDSLDAFTAKAFGIIEPSTEYMHNWHVSCLPYSAKIETPSGVMSIGDIVESNYSGLVLSYNHKTNRTEWKNVTARMKRDGVPTYTMLSSLGYSLEGTGNHPIYANGAYVNLGEIKPNDKIVSLVQERVSDRAEPRKILRAEMLCGETHAKARHNLSNLQGCKGLYRNALQGLQRVTSKDWLRTAVRILRQDCLQKLGKSTGNEKGSGGVLRHALPCGIYEGQPQSGLYRWWQDGQGFISACKSQAGKAEGYAARGWYLLSLLRSAEASGDTSPRQEHKQQRSLEYGSALPSVSQQTEGQGGSRDFSTSQCFVVSITKNLQIPESVYNIEVADNNNYFANGILTHNCIAEHLQAVWDNEIRLLIINMPPRSLKTHTTSVSFPAWGLGRNPATQFMLTSFKSSLAEKMTRKTRKIMQSEWYRQCFPETKLSEELNRQYYFETTERGQYFSSSMSNVTGEGADIQILDDAISPDEALSDQVRNSTNETIRGTLFSRFNDPRTGRFILNMQRLHDDDPTGNLLRDAGWYHLKLPAEAKAKSYFYTIRGKSWTLPQDKLLFPARFTREVLDKTRTRLGDYSYAGQYLQEPVPITGGMINGQWLQYYAPGSVKPKEMNIAILVDPAGGDEDEKQKKDKNSDWTAMMVVGLARDNNYYLLDIIRDRLNPTERIDTLFMLHRKWNTLAGKSPKVGYEMYSMQSDSHYIKQKMKDEAYNFSLFIVSGQKSKTARVSRLVPDMQNARWFVPQSLVYVDVDGRKWDLVQELLNSEIKTFPMSKHDDMLDALSRIYEPELCMAFPRLTKTSMVAKARREMAEASSGSWEDF